MIAHNVINKSGKNGPVIKANGINETKINRKLSKYLVISKSFTYLVTLIYKQKI